MGIFSLPPLNTIQIHMISRSDDPWVTPSSEQIDSFGDLMPLSPIKIDYCELITASEPLSFDCAPLSMSLEIYSQSPWLGDLDSLDPLKEVFPSNEVVVETMPLEDLPWNDGHHRSSFMPGLGAMSTCIEHFVSQVPYYSLQLLVLTHDIFTEGNLSNITQTMPIDISIKTEIVENPYWGYLFF